VRRLEARGVEVHRTDLEGTVTIESDGRALSTVPARKPALATTQEIARP
jgi:beta-lactamase superfamily II metal-dependent hydrolase